MDFNNQMSGESGAGKGRFFVFVGVFLVIMLVAGGGYFGWNKYFSQEAKTQRNYQKYLDWQANYEKAMQEDTYGGKTPQETLDMFIVALKKGDVELASKYFMLNENGAIDQKWINYLINLKQTGNLVRLANDISKEAQPTDSLYKGNFQFKLYNDDGTTGLLINMQLNKSSNVWKIESL